MHWCVEVLGGVSGKYLFAHDVDDHVEGPGELGLRLVERRGEGGLGREAGGWGKVDDRATGWRANKYGRARYGGAQAFTLSASSTSAMSFSPMLQRSVLAMQPSQTTGAPGAQRA